MTHNKEKIKPIVKWAVINTDLNEICATGKWNEGKIQLDYEGSAVFDSKQEARSYERSFPKNNFIKLAKVRITPIK